MDEIRLALRRLRQRRSPAMASIVTLAGAIGAAAATWSVLSALLLHPLPVRDPSSLMVVGTAQAAGASQPGRTTSTFVYPRYIEVRDSGAFQEVAGVWPSAAPFTIGEQKGAVPAAAVFVSAGFFDIVGVGVSLGRGITPEDDRRGAAPVAVISDSFWRTRLGADPAVLGRVLTLDRARVTVVGVAARGFRGLTLTGAPALYLPLETIEEVGHPFVNYFARPNTNYSPTAGVTIIGRLRPGESSDQVTARLAALPGASRGTLPRLLPVNSTVVPEAARENIGHFARLLSATVALLLFIGCSTVGMLLLVRTEARRVELATCLALGATRARLARGIVAEGAVLAAAGAALSPLVAWWIFSAIATYQLPGGVSLGLLGLELDASALGVAAVSAVLATLLIAVMAGAFGFRANVADSLRAQSGATPRLGRRPTRALLLATQTAVALALVAATGLFARSLAEGLKLNARFDSARIASATIRLAPAGYTPEAASAYYQDLARRVAANPAIAAMATSLSTGGMGANGRLTIDGEPRTFPNSVEFRSVDNQYFSAMRMRVLRGRRFGDADRAGAPQVGIVSESFGRMIASGGNPLGRRISVTMGGKLDVEIVGVTDDLFNTVRDAEPLALYLPMAQSLSPPVNRTVVFRAAADVDAARREMEAAIGNADPRIEHSRPQTLDERLMRELAPQQFGMIVLGTLGAIALVLSLLGTYVLAESMAVTRTRELGIRAALGSTRSGLAAIVVREAAMLVGAGIAGGVGIAWLGAGTLRALLFRVQPLDPFTLAPVALLILILALLVSLRPALKAARVDLASVLRAE